MPLFKRHGQQRLRVKVIRNYSCRVILVWYRGTDMQVTYILHDIVVQFTC